MRTSLFHFTFHFLKHLEYDVFKYFFNSSISFTIFFWKKLPTFQVVVTSVARLLSQCDSDVYHIG